MNWDKLILYGLLSFWTAFCLVLFFVLILRAS